MEPLSSCPEDLVEGIMSSIYTETLSRGWVSNPCLSIRRRIPYCLNISRRLREENPYGMSVPGALPCPFPHSSVSWLLLRSNLGNTSSLLSAYWPSYILLISDYHFRARAWNTSSGTDTRRSGKPGIGRLGHCTIRAGQWLGRFCFAVIVQC
jgi:hypothetical protein